MNIEAAPKDTMRRPTLPGLGEGWHGANVFVWTTSSHRFAGVVDDGMSTRNNGQHGKPVCARPIGWVGKGERPLCNRRVAEGLVVLMKPGNSGGGKGP